MTSWARVRVFGVGGLVAVGFPDEGHVVVGSHSGLRILDVHAGFTTLVDDVAGDYAWLDEASNEAVWVDDEGKHVVPVAGLWGGTLPLETDEGWRGVPTASGVEVTGPGGQRAFTIEDADEPRAVGFSPGGRVFVFATSASLYVTFQQAELVAPTR